MYYVFFIFLLLVCIDFSVTSFLFPFYLGQVNNFNYFKLKIIGRVAVVVHACDLPNKFCYIFVQPFIENESDPSGIDVNRNVDKKANRSYRAKHFHHFLTIKVSIPLQSYITVLTIRGITLSKHVILMSSPMTEVSSKLLTVLYCN